MADRPAGVRRRGSAPKHTRGHYRGGLARSPPYPGPVTGRARLTTVSTPGEAGRVATRRRSSPARRATSSRRGSASTGRSGRRGATASRATRSARGRREFGLGIASTWARANYAYPRGVGKDRGKRPSYPINPRRVAAARSYAARRDTAGSLSGVDRALRARYGSVAKAMAAHRRAVGAGRGRRRG